MNSEEKIVRDLQDGLVEIVNKMMSENPPDELMVETFRPQTVVRHRANGRVGVVCNDLPGILRCCGPNEVAVVYDGKTSFKGEDWRNLEIVGPENAKADFVKCGAGRGEECCIFLVVGPNGPECQRFGSLRWDLIFCKLNAKRHPERLYPHCQFGDPSDLELIE